ncbi:AAA family ATPase [Oleiharenicola lentus]|uniref:AAA family ATPase n=1 Tax=Oleiharenicola lentus TaxID=2508720 RepID=UPI003F67F9EC
MLVSFSVSNLLSFKDSVDFTTRATRERQHGHRVFTHQPSGTKLVPAAAILGANASGKSNFYRAILLVRKLVLQSPQSPDEALPIEPFKLDDGESEGKPSRFVIEILPADTIYRLTIAVTRRGIIEEKLEELGNQQATLLYSRLTLRTMQEWDVEGLQDRTRANDRDFIGFKTRDTLPNQLFLGALRGKQLPVIDLICGWFSEQLALMLPETTLRKLEFNLPTTTGLLEFCNETLRTAGTGVEEVQLERVSWEDFPVPAELKEEIQKNLADRQSTFVLSPDGRRFSITRHHGELRVSRIHTHHLSRSGKKVRFELTNESEGTQRFLDLLPAFFEMVRPGRPKVFIIDELDRSLHAQLAKHLVQGYLNAMHAEARSQLIFTTHDVTLLDQQLLRRDEIWFMEKNASGASTMRSLAEFSGIRYDLDIRRSYLDGKFGGVPHFTAPAFQSMITPRLFGGGPSIPEPKPNEHAPFAEAFPANPADEMVLALTLNLLDVRGAMSRSDLLDTLILATHPAISRPLAGTRPTRKLDEMFSRISSHINLIEQTGLRWTQCLRYLEKRRAIVCTMHETVQMVRKGPEFQKICDSIPVNYVPMALFALSVFDVMKESKWSRGPTAEKSFANRSFEQLRTRYVAT